ncbi:AMP-binding protein [Streptomyces sp. 15-116A]|uniref:AMP-binding protein n=1 Tax=Streptomyces sp. 15-116A TaxID=2259035 RepID=UPI0021B2C9B6|nr:AMP-binding protein [Streptomyces sp. 15-116A]MCT7353971.1 AMP-binding protein [Streptomyces sp. 15-116A]
MTNSARTEEYLADVRARQRRVWPRSVPTQVVYPLGERPLADHLAHWAAHCPDRVALAFYGRHITYAQLEDLTARLCGWLQRNGVRPGDRVGVFLPNCPQFIVTMLAVLRAGAVHVPVNPMFREHELRHELADAEVEVLIALDTLRPVVDAVRTGTNVRTVLVTSLADLLPADPALPLPPGMLNGGTGVSGWELAVAGDRGQDAPGDLDALAALNYTGGTTGLPKGCAHTQRHMLYTAATCAASCGLDTSGDRPDVLLIHVPVFWIAGEDFGILLTGYWRQPEATRRVLRDGWLHTGDIGMIDEDGCLHYLGRDKEMIKVSGMSVFPSEVEALLTRHPDVLSAAVVPMDDPERGQVPLAFVQARPGTAVEPEDLRAWARQNMAPYKVPVTVCLDALPMTTTGKVKKGELLEEAKRMAATPAATERDGKGW